MKTVSPLEAQGLLQKGAMLIDIREADEYAREHIPGAHNHALSKLATHPPRQAEIIIYHCRSGNRTLGNASALEKAAACEAYVLEGGIDGWKVAGLPVRKDASRPIELMRQVQIAAGSLVVTGAILGAFVNPGFHALSGLVGAGLVFAGVTGTCGMARLLAVMPWNRRRAAA